MNLQNAAALWWLLPLAGIVVALYLLRMRRRDVFVPARFLWPERTDEVRANALFQRLRFSWLLVLQLLALALIVLSLARPQSLQKGLAGKVTVVVLDASASMGATDVNPTRFDAAVQVVKDMVESAGATDQLMLIEAGPVPRVVFPLSNDTSAHVRALATLRRSDAPSDIGEALRLAATRVGEIEGAKIVLLSDGVFPEVEDFAAGKASVVYQSFGNLAKNVAIQALGTSESPDGRIGICTIKNFGRDSAEVALSVFADGELIESQQTSLAANAQWAKEFAVLRETKVVEARIETNDALPADDYAVSLVDAGTSLRVLLITKGDPFLERALSLDPRVTLDKTDSLPTVEREGEPGPTGYDIVIFEGVAEQAVKAKAVLTLGVAGTPTPVTASGRGGEFTFLDSADDPIVDGVDLSQVYIENVQNVKPKAIGKVVVEGTSGSLIVTAKGTKRQVYVAFAPLDSDFPLTVAFPIFVSNALDFLAESSTSNIVSVRAGQQFQIAAKSEESATLSRPDGSKEDIAPIQGRYIVRGVDAVGSYTIDIDGKQTRVFADMRDPQESNIDPRQFVSIKNDRLDAVSDLRRFADFWRPLILIALLVLAAEWWLYARRS